MVRLKKSKQDFPQTELQEYIMDFWSVRGYSKVTAVLGNLNVSFHKENPKYGSLGLSLQYLEQFYSEAQEKALDVILEIIKVERATSIDYLKSRIKQIKNKRNQQIRKGIGELL